MPKPQWDESDGEVPGATSLTHSGECILCAGILCLCLAMVFPDGGQSTSTNQKTSAQSMLLLLRKLPLPFDA